MFFVVKTVKNYLEVSTFGPFSSLEDAQQSVTDGLVRGVGGKETKYTFFEYSSYVNRVDSNFIEEIGYVNFKDDSECGEGDIRFDYFNQL